MFTGLIETMGQLNGISRENKSAVFSIIPQSDDFDCKIGDSVAINGVCLTIERKIGKILLFRAVNETLAKTTLANIQSGSLVNLERAMSVNGRLDGHIVLGHVDTIAKIMKIENVGD